MNLRPGGYKWPEIGNCEARQGFLAMPWVYFAGLPLDGKPVKPPAQAPFRIGSGLKQGPGGVRAAPPLPVGSPDQ